ALWGNGYKTYAHLADIAALDLLKGMITEDSTKSGISKEYYDKVKEAYLTPVCLKKIDIGGGLIHGNAEDFKKDTSQKILLSHNALPLTDMQKEIGDNTSFGAVDVLISSQQDYSKRFIYQYLRTYFPDVPQYEINMLLNCPVTSFNPGAILVRKGEKNKYVFILLSGLMEFINHDMGINNKLTVGSMAGELSGLMDNEVSGTYRAVSYVKVLQVPCNIYVEFLKRNNIFDDFKNNIGERYYLQNTWLFGERVSCPQKSKLAQAMKMENYTAGEVLPTDENDGLFLLYEGEIAILSKNKIIEYLKPGGFFGEESIINNSATFFNAHVEKPSKVYRIPEYLIKDIPIVQWKLLEAFKRRKGAVDL
ncbi:MAG: cyclic nucleotide-binding protein, partial [Firmicutes bacterium HGW-Firmicutes-15]